MRGVDARRLGVCVFPEISARQVVDAARLAEDLGLGFLGVGDVQELWADPWIALGLAAAATRTLELGPWVTNPLTRHPTVTANAVVTLDDVSDGRAFLGLGVGDGAVRTSGGRPATIAALGEAVEALRGGIAARAAAHGGRRPPIFWAAASDRSTRAGARCADGVIVSGWITPEMLGGAVTALREGAAEAGRPADAVTPIFNTAVAIDDDGAAAVAAARPYVARALARASSARVAGWSEADVERFRHAYDYQRHFRDDHALRELVPAELVPRKAIAGTPPACAALLRQVLAAGFERVALIPMGGTETVLRRLVRDVLPLVAEPSR